MAIIGEATARHYFKNESPLGRRFALTRNGVSLEIVGVVGDAKFNDLRAGPQRFVYLPYLQNPFSPLGQMTLYVWSRGERAAGASAIRRIVQEVDPKLPIFDLKPIATVIDESLVLDRLLTALSACFGLLATLLAAIGLYGVMSYAVGRRRREIGVRLALGAERRRLLWMIEREVIALLVVGLAVGLPLTFALGRWLASQLFGLTPVDPPTFVLATLIIAGVAVLAGLMPARRAASVNPVEALRAE